MNVLSTFDGSSCGREALERIGITPDVYYSSEIDKFAMTVSNKNYPDIIKLGDVTNVRAANLPKIDLLLGGSPCQGFSFAGRQLAFDDERSKLFFEFVRLWREIKSSNPDAYFLLENVKMKKEFQRVISDIMGVEPIEINSSLLSAQNRKRLYWTNIPGVVQPKDLGLKLRDILQDDYEVDEKYYLSDKMLDYFIRTSARLKDSGNGYTFKIKNPDDKSFAITTREGGRIENNFILVRQVGRNPDNPTSRQVGLPTVQMLEPRNDDKSNCLTTVTKDNLLIKLGQLSEKDRQGDRVYSPDGKAACLNAAGGNNGGHTGLYKIGARIRRLTPIECERLQTLPDDYTAGVSDTQRYKMLGNGWTVDVIAHILKNLPLKTDNYEL